jgi:MoaA/NifB/PqqE/SkfB family radical SAM enzyme
VDEAWLSELKPSVEDFWSDEYVISEDERRRLAKLQDDWNKASNGMVVNYLGHFEGGENFGCNAGYKMVYVDAFGEVSPCVFLPLSLGNVRERPLKEILFEMGSLFPGQSRCFINANYRLLAGAGSGGPPVDREDTVQMLRQVQFGPPSEFNRRLRGGRAESWRMPA